MCIDCWDVDIMLKGIHLVETCWSLMKFIAQRVISSDADEVWWMETMCRKKKRSGASLEDTSLMSCSSWCCMSPFPSCYWLSEGWSVDEDEDGEAAAAADDDDDRSSVVVGCGGFLMKGPPNVKVSQGKARVNVSWWRRGGDVCGWCDEAKAVVDEGHQKSEGRRSTIKDFISSLQSDQKSD